jgi:hypothetical protein
MIFGDIILSEINQKQKDKYHIISPICEIQKILNSVKYDVDSEFVTYSLYYIGVYPSIPSIQSFYHKNMLNFVRLILY